MVVVGSVGAVGLPPRQQPRLRPVPRRKCAGVPDYPGNTTFNTLAYASPKKGLESGLDVRKGTEARQWNTLT